MVQMGLGEADIHRDDSKRDTTELSPLKPKEGLNGPPGVPVPVFLQGSRFRFVIHLVTAFFLSARGP